MLSFIFIHLLAAEEEKDRLCNSMQHEMCNIMNGVKNSSGGETTATLKPHDQSAGVTASVFAVDIAARVYIGTTSTGDDSAQEAAGVDTESCASDVVTGDTGVDVTAGLAMDKDSSSDGAVDVEIGDTRVDVTAGFAMNAEITSNVAVEKAEGVATVPAY